MHNNEEDQSRLSGPGTARTVNLPRSLIPGEPTDTGHHFSRFSPAGLFSPPALVSKRMQRGYQAAMWGALAGLAIHIIMTVLFFTLDVRPMFYLNLASDAYWLLILIVLVRYGRIFLAVVLAAIELILHQTAAIYILGWDFGFQNYLFLVALVMSLVLVQKIPARIGLIGVAAGVYLFNYFVVQHLQPHVPLPQFVGDIFFAANTLGVVMCIALLSFAYSRAVIKAEDALEREHIKSVRLLHNILPVPIANQLRDESHTIAEGHNDVSVLFSDIVGFTRMSENVTPQELVRVLNEIFTRFDLLAEKMGLEKIKTIGDAYMVAAGIPLARPDHAQIMAAFALCMIDEIEDFNARNDQQLSMRIGIHSGPVVAGVIGRIKFSYDLWGDTVNTAARMESHGEPGQIHVTETTRDLLQNQFSFSDRGIINIKGKGPMRTFFLEKPDTAFTPRPAD